MPLAWLSKQRKGALRSRHQTRTPLSEFPVTAQTLTNHTPTPERRIRDRQSTQDYRVNNAPRLTLTKNPGTTSPKSNPKSNPVTTGSLLGTTQDYSGLLRFTDYATRHAALLAATLLAFTNNYAPATGQSKTRKAVRLSSSPSRRTF